MQIVANIIINDQNQLLILKRSGEHTSFPNKWCFVTGILESDSDPTNQSFQEIQEELGERINVKLLEIGKVFRERATGKNYTVHPFLFHYISGEVKLNKEHTQYRWVDAAQINQMDTVPGLVEDLNYLNYLK